MMVTTTTIMIMILIYIPTALRVNVRVLMHIEQLIT